MKFSKLAQTYDRIAEARREPERVKILADLFAVLDAVTLGAAAHLTLGEVVEPVLNNRVGIGPGMMRDLFARLIGREPSEIEDELKGSGDLSALAEDLPAGRDTLSVADLWKRMNRMAERDEDRARVVEYVLGHTTPAGARYFTRMILNQMRINVGLGVIAKALAAAFDMEPRSLEHLYAMTNDIGMVAERAKKGKRAIESAGLALFHPYQFMNANRVESPEEIFEALRGKKILFEVKYDGARLQIHIEAGAPHTIRLYSRRLNDVTESLPDVVEALRDGWKGGDAIVEGEAVAYDRTLKTKQPFESVLMRLGRRYDIEQTASELPFVLHLFDILYDCGADLMETPQTERRQRLRKLVAPGDRLKLTDAIETSRVADEAKFFAKAIRMGHEGVMAKDPDACYIPGRRTDNWMKLKPAFETLDVVIVGGIWGSGRRRGMLSSLLVAVRDRAGFKTVGKVGAGFTEAKMRELTAKLEPLVVASHGRTVEIEPCIVIEVDFQSIQKTTAYESGYALRIPRFKHERADKSVREADTLERLKKLYGQIR